MSYDKFIMGVYPAAPSFHYKNEEDDNKFFSLITDNPKIAGLEQPCLDEFHILGNDYLFKTIPSDWKIVITAIMYTMSRRAKEANFGLASVDEEGRVAAINYIKHIAKQIETVQKRYGQDRFLALETQSAPLKGDLNLQGATDAFAKSLKEIKALDLPCEIVIEHCDALNGTGKIKKGFLPLDQEIKLAKEYGLKLCINWARCILEGADHSLKRAEDAIAQCVKEDVLSGILFSGTSNGGAWGDFEDNHAPFAPFENCRINCPESLMTLEAAASCLKLASSKQLSFVGAKLLESDAKASVAHRANIILDGVDALSLINKGA